MNIQVKIDQAEAVRIGIDAPSSTADVRFDPAELTEEQRDVLADDLKNGYYTSFTVTEPTLERLREALDAAVLRRKQARQAQEEVDAWFRKEEEKAATAAMKIDPTDPTHYRPFDGIRIPRRADFREEYLSPETVEKLEKYNRDVDAIRESLLKEHHQRRRRNNSLFAVARTLREIAYAAEFATAYAKIPPELQERYEAGYAPRKEVLREVHRAIRAARRLPTEMPEYEYSEAIEALNSRQFARLKEIREQLFEGGSVDAVRVWSSYRPATHEDDPAEIDADGDVRTNEQCLFLIHWREAGMHMYAAYSAEF